MCLWMGAFAIPRDDKRYRGGEDAWFFDFQTSGLGVADGVSEWEELAGVNPQEYAIDLMRGAKDALLKRRAERAFPRPCEEAAAGIGSASRLNDKAPAATATGTENPPPSQVAREALTTAYEEASHFGSSTAIVGVLDGHSGVFGTRGGTGLPCWPLRQKAPVACLVRSYEGVKCIFRNCQHG